MEKLDSAQLDQLKEIGAYLHQVRQEQSKSLEEIATKTCIRLPLLRAVEQGQEQGLPEPVFVQGFIRRYADALGLDGMTISRAFPINSPLMGHVLKPRGTSDTGTYNAPISEPLEESKYSLRSSREFINTSPSPFQTKGAYALYAAAILAIGGLAYSFFKPATPRRAAANSPTPSAPIASSSANPVSASPSPKLNLAPTVSGSSQPSISPPASIAGAPVTLGVRLTGDSWMQVLVDGEVQFEGVLNQGTQRTWSAKNKITVVAGNAGAVSVSSNNGAVKPMGRAGDVRELVVTSTTR